MAERPEHAPALRCADDDEASAREEQLAEPPVGMGRGDVDHEVEPLTDPGEVLLRVVEHAISAELARLLDIARAADRRDVRCAERLRDLHREGADATRRGVHEDPLSCPERALVAERLDRRDRSHRDGGRLLERQVGRLLGNRILHAHVLGEGTRATAVDLVAHREVGHGLADCLDHAREVGADPRLPGRAEPRRRTRDEQPRHRVPVGRVDRARADAYENLVVGRCRLLELHELEHLRASVAVLDDSPHRPAPFTVRTTFPTFCQLSTYRAASATSSSG